MLAAVLALEMSASSPNLDRICTEAAHSAMAEFAKTELKEEHLSLFVMIKRSGEKVWEAGGFRPDFAMYPASVVKMFYLAYASKEMQAGRLKSEPEHQRAFRDMIQDSSNDATGLVLDLLTGTTGGPALGPKALAAWMKKRQKVNEWIKGQGIEGINACQKTWNEGPYGRERQGYGPNFELRNSATARGTSLLLAGILDGTWASGPSQEWAKGLLQRDLVKADSQTRTYIGKVAPKDLSWYGSKAGWAYKVRHDTAALVRANGDRMILTVYTDFHGTNLLLVPHLASHVLGALGWIPQGDLVWKEDIVEPDPS
jgi:hypothetical protein